MAFDLFDRPIFARRKYFVQEITGIDDVFDFLDEWPQEERNLAYETMVKICRDAASGQRSTQVVRENFQRFLMQHGKLAEVDDIAPFMSAITARTSEAFDSRRRDRSELGAAAQRP